VRWRSFESGDLLMAVNESCCRSSRTSVCEVALLSSWAACGELAGCPSARWAFRLGAIPNRTKCWGSLHHSAVGCNCPLAPSMPPGFAWLAPRYSWSTRQVTRAAVLSDSCLNTRALHRRRRSMCARARSSPGLLAADSGGKGIAWRSGGVLTKLHKRLPADSSVSRDSTEGAVRKRV
jgi:hypothetical protein